MHPSDVNEIVGILQDPTVVAVMKSPAFLECASRTVNGQSIRHTQVPAAMPTLLQNSALTQKIAKAYTKMHGFSA